MQSNIKQNIYYKKQIQQRQLQLIGMLEVEQYIDMEEQPQNQQSSDDLDDTHWESIEYTFNNPIRKTSKSLQECISYDLMRYFGKKAYFSQDIIREDADQKSQIVYAFELRSNHALIDCFQYVVINKEDHLEIIPLFQKTKQKDINKQIIQAIKNVNKRWQFEGIYIKTIVECGKDYQIMVQLPNQKKGYLIWSRQREISSLMDQIRYYFLDFTVRNIPVKQNHVLKNDLTIKLDCSIDLEELRQFNLYQKIILFFNLSRNFGLSLKIDRQTNDLIDITILKANNVIYSQITRHIAELYYLQESESQHQQQSQQKEYFNNLLIKLIQCDQKEQYQFLHKLYQYSLKFIS